MTSRDLFNHNHFPNETDELILDNCSACALNGRNAIVETINQCGEFVTLTSPNYTGWERVYIAAKKPIPKKFASAFIYSLNNPRGNTVFHQALLQDIKTHGFSIEK